MQKPQFHTCTKLSLTERSSASQLFSRAAHSPAPRLPHVYHREEVDSDVLATRDVHHCHQLARQVDSGLLHGVGVDHGEWIGMICIVLAPFPRPALGLDHGLRDIDPEPVPRRTRDRLHAVEVEGEIVLRVTEDGQATAAIATGVGVEGGVGAGLGAGVLGLEADGEERKKGLICVSFLLDG